MFHFYPFANWVSVEHTTVALHAVYRKALSVSCRCLLSSFHMANYLLLDQIRLMLVQFCCSWRGGKAITARSGPLGQIKSLHTWVGVSSWIMLLEQFPALTHTGAAFQSTWKALGSSNRWIVLCHLSAGRGWKLLDIPGTWGAFIGPMQ